ncbi:MAG: aminopeptidase [Thermacetogeniaceae bacterium]
MRDPRVNTLAGNLINYSCGLQPGERVLIEAIGLEAPLVTALIEQAYAAGGMPFVTIKDRMVDRAVLVGCSEGQMRQMARYEAARMSEMDAYVGVRSGDNAAELADVPQDRMELYQKHFWEEVHGKIRVPKTRWVVLRYPAPSMAQLANTSTEGFEDFYFMVCNLDYARMSRAMRPLVDRMNGTDRVRITAPGTDLSFSISGLPAIRCDGHMNIPDGEVYTAPVRDSVNGCISYNTPARHQGFTYEQIRLEFRNGQIIGATANDTARINKVLDVDAGARHVGEFSLGINPYITRPIGDTLFDEKIAGSIHFTPGSAYDDCFNGNRSALHWDLVLIQTPEYGGGEIYFDDLLIRKDGRFTPPELDGLNPENLK